MLPVELGELQNAVDAAHALLAVEASRRYGLVAGGPVADVDACEAMLERGRCRGVTPAPRAIEGFVRELLAA